MVKILWIKDIADRLNVSVGTVHKKEFQKRLGLPLEYAGKRPYIPEPKWDEWVLNPSGSKGNEQN